MNSKKRFAVYSLSQKRVIKGAVAWPRLDGTPIVGQDPDLVYLERINLETPKAEEGKVMMYQGHKVDLDQMTYTPSWIQEDIPLNPVFETVYCDGKPVRKHVKVTCKEAGELIELLKSR